MTTGEQASGGQPLPAGHRLVSHISTFNGVRQFSGKKLGEEVHRLRDVGGKMVETIFREAGGIETHTTEYREVRGLRLPSFSTHGNSDSLTDRLTRSLTRVSVPLANAATWPGY